MPKTNYTPFEKDLDALTESDLEKLIENKIAEGWYIEYKSRVPGEKNEFDRVKIAKSISSFANTKGGWIFWGIDCADNFPTQLSGIDTSTHRNFQDTLSQIIASNISPKPIYHFKEVSLASGSIIFVILVEESPLPPYITSQGVIYQRENNESKPIKDRYVIEKLNERAKDYINSIENFSQFDLGQTRGQTESNQSFLELYLFPKPFNSFRLKKFHESQFFKDVATRFYQSVDFQFSTTEKMVPMSLLFNSIYNTGHSLIIRALNDSNLIYKGTTAELFFNGNLKFTFAVNSFQTNNIPEHYQDSQIANYLLDKYTPFETVEEFSPFPHLRHIEPNTVTRRKLTDFASHVEFIDGFDLIMVITILLEKYKAVLQDNNFEMSADIGMRARVTNTWRKFVFFDNENYLEKIKLFNIPIIPKNEIEMPEFRNGNSFNIQLNEKSMSVLIAHLILEKIGLPDSSSIKLGDIFEKGLRRFVTE